MPPMYCAFDNDEEKARFVGLSGAILTPAYTDAEGWQWFRLDGLNPLKMDGIDQ